MRILAAFIFASFCACTGEVQYNRNPTPVVSASVTADAPDLVEVAPGVQVVADYDEPVFYADGAYWRSSSDGWYRSDNYASGWVFAASPPEAVVRIQSPNAFIHYRPAGYVARHREYRRPEPIREHRAEVETRGDHRD